MILFPNAKINLGLRILSRRPDGYHELETIMLPVGWCDVLEIVPSTDKETHFSLVGTSGLDCQPEDNLVMKAIRAVEKHLGRKLPPMDIYLKKVIPFGAGLGGGSADASFAIRGVNELFSLGMDLEEMARIAVTVGADCPFFVYNRPMLAKGIGEVLTPVDIPDIDKYTILIVKPKSEGVSTREAYSRVKIGMIPFKPLMEILGGSSIWFRDCSLVNDFEQSIFPIRPEIMKVKDAMWAQGAFYSSMSGSGAAVYGLFDDAKMAESAAREFADCDIYCGPLCYKADK